MKTITKDRGEWGDLLSFQFSEENVVEQPGGMWGRLVTGTSLTLTVESTAREEIQQWGNRITNKIEEKLKKKNREAFTFMFL